MAVNKKIARSCSAIGCTNCDTKENRLKKIRFYRIHLKQRNHKWYTSVGFNRPPDSAICNVHLVGVECFMRMISVLETHSTLYGFKSNTRRKKLS